MGTFRSNLPLGTSDPTVFVEGNVPNLDEAINSHENIWYDRFGNPHPTIQAAVDPTGLVQQAVDAAISAEDSASIAQNVSDMNTYLTKSDADAAMPLPEGTFIRVTNDPDSDNNGYWVSNGSMLVFSGLQPVSSAGLEKKLDKNTSPDASVLFSVTDNKGGATDITVRREDGQFAEFVIKRLAMRISQYLGLYNQPLSLFPQIPGGDYSLTGRDYYERNGELLPILTDMSMFAGWGSSSMQRSATYFTSLATEFGASYYNGGVGGQQTEHIAARLGSIPAQCTFPGNTIPSNTSPVAVTVDGRGLHFNQDYLGVIGGVHGRLWSDGGVATFARTTAGASVSIEDKTPFIPDEGARNRAALTFLWMGRNDLTSDDRVESCVKNTDTSFDFIAPFAKRTLVLGHFKGDLTPSSPSWNRIDTVNAAHRRRFGLLFVDVNAYLISPQVWIDMGITPTQQDLDEQAVGTTPASLRADGLHLTPAAYQAVVTFCVRARLIELGWITP